MFARTYLYRLFAERQCHSGVCVCRYVNLQMEGILFIRPRYRYGARYRMVAPARPLEVTARNWPYVEVPVPRIGFI